MFNVVPLETYISSFFYNIFQNSQTNISFNKSDLAEMIVKALKYNKLRRNK